MFNRFIYLGYHILKTPRKDFFRIFNHVKREKKVSAIYLYKDIILSSLRYNVSVVEYFKLRLFNYSHEQREQYAGSGFMYRYQLEMNPKGHRDVLENKIKFLEHFSAFSGRKWSTYQKLLEDQDLTKSFLNNVNGKVVLKDAVGQAGKDVTIYDCTGKSENDLLTAMKEKGYDLIEHYVVQHEVLMKVAPRGLNTVRIITQLHNGQVDIIGTSLRLSVEKNVDNISVGGLVVLIDPASGKTTGPGYYTDPTKPNVNEHPLTKHPISGFTIPYWDQCKELARKAAFLTPENKSIGWDIAVTNDGPILIEGNHNWNTGVWQIPLQRGMKSVLLKYLPSAK